MNSIHLNAQMFICILLIMPGMRNVFKSFQTGAQFQKSVANIDDDNY